MKRLLIGAGALILSIAASATTLNPVQLLNPTGSTSGQAVVSTGASTAPGWANVAATALAAQAANTVVANVTASSASPTAFAMPSCSTSTSALNWTNGTGFTCGGSGFAALSGATFTGDLTVSEPSAALIMNDTSGTGFPQFVYRSSGVNKWIVFDAPSTHLFTVNRYVGGTFQDTPLTISNSSGVVTMTDGITASPISGSSGAFTTLSSSGVASLGTGSTIATSPSRGDSTSKAATTFFVQDTLMNPPAIGSGTAAAGKFTTLQATSTITPSTTAGIVGTTLADNAQAGSVGEVISSQISAGSAVSLTANVPANITSISLTAGDWDVWGTICTNPAGSTAQSNTQGAISTSSATFPAAPNGGAFVLAPYTFGAAGTPTCLPVGLTRADISSTTTYYLVIQSNFATSTNGGYGFLGARRVR